MLDRLRLRLPLRLLLPALLVTLLPLAGPAAAQDDLPPAPELQVEVPSWLVLGPVAAPLPAFAGETGFEEDEAGQVEPADVLTDVQIPWPEVWPAAGDAVAWVGSGTLTWSEQDAPVTLDPSHGAPAVAHLAVYLEAERFLQAKLTVSTAHLVQVFLDGEPVGEKSAADGAPEEAAEEGDDDGGEEDGEGEDGEDESEEAEEPEPGSAKVELALTPGTHLLLVKAVRVPDLASPWRVAAGLSVSADHRAALSAGTSPRHGIVMSDLLDVEQVASLATSPDGRWVALALETPTVPADHHQSWIEIRATSDGALARTLRGSPEAADFSWGPAGLYAYVTRKDGKATLWAGDLEAGTVEPLLEGVERLGGHRFSPDGATIFYTVSREAKPDEREVQRLRSPQDRWAGFREISEIHQVSVADGSRRQLTAGALSVDLHDVAPDGGRVLFSRARATTERPFMVGELYELDLGLPTLSPRKVTDVTWLNAAGYTPDGNQVWVSAGPSGFGDVGLDVPAGVVPNDYEGELYLTDLNGASVRPLTRDFDPAVDEVAWAADGSLVVRATETSFVHLYRVDPATGTFTRLPTGVDAVTAMSLAEDGSTLVYAGSGATLPPRVMARSPRPEGDPRTLLVPSEAAYDLVDFGRVEDFDFEAEDGSVIPGRVYYPPDFDAGKKYPLLVYYYGGVVPTERSFGGRYPKNWWAAQGYVVYVLQPSGAVGFGQERAARHVNDWGQRTAEEIIRGVEAFLSAHPFVDRDKIGHFGGSYGGFMTMLLATQTDLFAASISHAGISSIASYWGEGWWGYLYSAVAGADSYPWNRPDLYVEQSPLFMADKITNPMLLLHGTSDPNVPPGESDQMFIALSLLGKEVEYVRIEGEAHWILSYPKRVLWWQTIIAWFDKHLKGEPEYWDHLWKGKG